MSSTLIGPDAGLSTLLAAIVARDGATADLVTRPAGLGRKCDSRCYSHNVGPHPAEPFKLKHPARLAAFDRSDVLPAGWTIVRGRDLSEPIGFMHH